MRISVLVPTRNRPMAAKNTLSSFEQTGPYDAEILFGLDSDEPRRKEYERLVGSNRVIVAPPVQSGSLSKVANWMVWTTDPYSIVGIIGDDHRFRSVGWEGRVRESLSREGIAYANDQYPWTDLPTAAFVSSGIVRSLGYLYLPWCDHMYLDNALKDIGQGIDRLTYMPDVVIEHMHFTTGKSSFDSTYARTNTNEKKDKDRAAYEKWRRERMEDDIERVRKNLD